MKATGHLPCLRCAFARSLSIETMPVPADDLGARFAFNHAAVPDVDRSESRRDQLCLDVETEPLFGSAFRGVWIQVAETWTKSSMSGGVVFNSSIW